jgi:EAL domain-containing protein (putative c-di-GMP-specific phosphodiesterase class I)
MRALTGTTRARTRTLLVVSALAMLVLTGLAALFAGQRTASITRSDARQRVAQRVDLLVTLGADLPNLSSSTVANGLSPAADRRLDAAVKRVQQEGLLADLVIWDRSGRIAYTSRDQPGDTPPPREPELALALAGQTTSSTHPNELDPSSRRHTGVLDAFHPLVDGHGVYGAMEASLPLRPVDVAAAASGRRSALYVLAGAALGWLLMIPLWFRLARSQANEWIPARRRTLRAFGRALDRGEIELVYQPQIEPWRRRIDGVEALVRWRRNGELIGPDRFLPAVESSPLMARLTDRVLDLALAQLARWRREGIAIRLSVNLSASDLADKTLPQRIGAQLAIHGVMGQSLTLEVTETAILEDAEQARLVLTVLDQMGIDIAVDDFGTGHASISRVQGLPVTEIKIDRSFVSDNETHSYDYLAAMVSFGHSLGLRVVAEGVEDAETLAILTTLKCDLAQGYHISRPLEADAMTLWLTTADPIASSPRAPDDGPSLPV